MSEQGQKLVQEFESYKNSSRTNFQLWQDVLDSFNPRQVTVFDNKITPGARKNQPKDKTGVLALQVFGAGMFSYVAPNDQKWGAYQDARKDYKDRDDIKKMWGEITELFITHIYESNFPQIGPQAMEMVGGEGTAVGIMEEGKDTLFNFKLFPIGTFFFGVDDRGWANRGYREFELSANEAIEKWPKGDKQNKGLGPTIEKALNSSVPEDRLTKHTFIHVVRPRQQYDPSKRDKLNMKYESFYIAKADNHVIEEGGYRTFPFFAVPARVQAPETWGRSPAMDALDEIETLHIMKQTKRKMAEISVNPDVKKRAGMPYPIRRGGGKVTLVDDMADVQEWDTKSNRQIAEIQTEEEREIIRKFLHNDLFELLAQLDTNTQRTALEIGKRVSEKLITISPLVGSIENKFIRFIMRRGLDIMNEKGILPEPPPDAEPLQYKMVLSNRVSIQLRALQNDDILQGLEIAQLIAQAQAAGGIDPDFLDNINFDELVEALENINFPQHAINGKEIVAQIREARAQQQQAVQASALANQSADTLNKLPPEAREQLALVTNN